MTSACYVSLVVLVGLVSLLLCLLLRTLRFMRRWRKKFHEQRKLFTDLACEHKKTLYTLGEIKKALK